MNLNTIKSINQIADTLWGMSIDKQLDKDIENPALSIRLKLLERFGLSDILDELLYHKPEIGKKLQEAYEQVLLIMDSKKNPHASTQLKIALRELSSRLKHTAQMIQQNESYTTEDLNKEKRTLKVPWNDEDPMYIRASYARRIFTKPETSSSKFSKDLRKLSNTVRFMTKGYSNCRVHIEDMIRWAKSENSENHKANKDFWEELLEDAEARKKIIQVAKRIQ